MSLIESYDSPTIPAVFQKQAQADVEHCLLRLNGQSDNLAQHVVTRMMVRHDMGPTHACSPLINKGAAQIDNGEASRLE